ncbi:hypothetical protein ATCC90586_008869 [Pythium insidiosum]|nr:hypothetical protein ATCC90586_008869 [Pythium insidiosum]
MSAAAATQPKAAGAKTKLAGKELKDAIKRQVEFYFSRSNLANDAFLVSQMNSQMYVPVDVIVGFAKIKELTDSKQLLVEAIADSKIVIVNESKDAIKPNIKSERNTIILREIPSATAPEEVKAIFEGCGEVTSVRSDVGDTWFVTMASEEDAVQTLLALRSKTFNNAPIKARLKSENLLKSFYPTQPAEPVVASSGVAASAAYARGYYASGAGYYDVPNNYGVQYAPRAQYNNGAADNNRRAGGRGAQNFRQGGRGNNAAGQHQHPKEGRAKSNSFEQQQRPGSRKAKDKKAKAAAQQQQTAGNGKKNGAAAAAERQPILNASNFPPLPATEKEAVQSEEIQHKYAHEDILEIVKNMDENDCKLADGKMDFEAHSVALTPVAHPDLLRNQRTYSIEQAREALRQGRPIRSDSIGSVDYESMMYGEDYTKEAREIRKQKAEASVAEGKAPEAAKPKVLGYAAAVINGTPAPQPTPEATPVAKKPVSTTPKAATKEEKKAPKKTVKTTKETKEPAVDESLPKTGAWGGRNFLEVVKSEPVNPPAAPVVAAPVKKAEPSKDAKDKASKERRPAKAGDKQ